MRRGHRVDNDGTATERFSLKTDPPELLLVSFECIELFIGKLECEREEQALGWCSGTAQLHHDRLIEHPLVGRVLIDDDYPVRALRT